MELSYFRSIADSLDSVKNAGVFATGGICSMPLPSLFVNSAPDAVFGLPLGKTQAESIMASCTEHTSVHHTWKLSPTKFSIRNPNWEKELSAVLAMVREKLGCDSTTSVTCELDGLLLCEPGAAFKVCR